MSHPMTVKRLNHLLQVHLIAIEIGIVRRGSKELRQIEQ